MLVTDPEEFGKIETKNIAFNKTVNKIAVEVPLEAIYFSTDYQPETTSTPGFSDPIYILIAFMSFLVWKKRK